MGQLVPNDLPMGKKADIRAQIDLMRDCGTVEVKLECAGEMNADDRQGLFFIINIICFLSLSRA